MESLAVQIQQGCLFTGEYLGKDLIQGLVSGYAGAMGHGPQHDHIGSPAIAHLHGDVVGRHGDGLNIRPGRLLGMREEL